MRKIPKIKIEQTELKMFSYEDLVVDPYWNDLYDPKNKQIKKNED
jgi:hypothetical protein